MYDGMTNAQRDRIERIGAEHPATLFVPQPNMGACAVFEYSDLESEGAFALTPAGGVLSLEYQPKEGGYTFAADALEKLADYARSN